MFVSLITQNANVNEMKEMIYPLTQVHFLSLSLSFSLLSLTFSFSFSFFHFDNIANVWFLNVSILFVDECVWYGCGWIWMWVCGLWTFSKPNGNPFSMNPLLRVRPFKIFQYRPNSIKNRKHLHQRKKKIKNKRERKSRKEHKKIKQFLHLKLSASCFVFGNDRIKNMDHLDRNWDIYSRVFDNRDHILKEYQKKIN